MLARIASCLQVVFCYAGRYGQQKIKYRSDYGKFLSTFKTTIYYKEYGKGSPLILLEGGMGSIARKSRGTVPLLFFTPVIRHLISNAFVSS